MGTAASDWFTEAEIERARRYHRPLYAAEGLETALAAGVLAALAWSPVGDALYGVVDGLPWPARAAGFAALVLLVSALCRLPLGFWRGFVRERRWGFSTQSAAGWLLDAVKGLALGLALNAALLLGLVALARALPGWWALPAGAASAAAVVFLVFVGPVVLEPVFNRFAPLADAALAAELRRIAERAGVPVREVLVADASRRTTKANAYVSGLGRTRRVVLFDTLLEQAQPPAIRLVVAHELGHRREGHVGKLTALGAAGAACFVAILWGVLGARVADPRTIPLVLLLGLALELAASPFVSALSRRWERDADRCSLELTRDAASFEQAHRALARENVIDLDPPRPLYLFRWSHPTPPERLAAARSWAGGA